MLGSSTNRIDHNSTFDIKNYSSNLIKSAKREFQRGKLPDKVWLHFLIVYKYLKENNLKNDSLLSNMDDIESLFGAKYLDINKLNILLSNFFRIYF